MTSNKLVIAAAVVTVCLAAFLLLDREYHLTGGHGKVVDDLIARNADARGGADAWRAVTSLRFDGDMDVGQDLSVPFVLEQKRPGKMCLEFEFDDATATQCIDDDKGWKLLPFMGRNYAEAMTQDELQEMVGAIELDGLLLDSDRRGSDVELVGQVLVNDQSASKLEITLPTGIKRWVYLDDETGLEIKVEAMRKLRGRERLVETYYSDWDDVDGLLIPRRQETRYLGSDNSHFMRVGSVIVNPPIEDERFAMPMSAQAASPSGNTL